MPFMPWFTKKTALPEAEQEMIVNAIRASEKKTSGEIRVYFESRCRYVDPMDRATQIFYKLEMDKTANHNAVLVYVAMLDRQMAIYADKGIYEKTGEILWNDAVNLMRQAFRFNHYGKGIEAVVQAVGDALHHHFPYDESTDKNELPDEIVFGK